MNKPVFAFVCTLLLLINGANAQFVPQSPEDEEFKTFLKSKITLVKTTGNAVFDSLLADALKQYWKITPYELVSSEELANRRGKADVSFLIPVDFEVTITNNNYWVTRSNMSLSLLNGGKKEYYATDQVAFACIDRMAESNDYRKDLSLDSAYLREKFRIKDMIATINRALQIVKDGDGGKIKTSNWYFGSSVVSQTCKPCAKSINTMAADVYNKQLPRLKNKTLYLLKENFRDTRDLAKAYPYKFKVVDRKEYAAAISQERKDIAYLMLTHSYWGGITIIDPSTHECIGAVHIDKCTTIDGRDLHEIVAVMEKVEKESAKK
ncbi:MAG: hypothetical protein V4615_14625 [Bacteroidota bacterium]